MVTGELSGVEPLSNDVMALCALLARIMHRCLAQQDERFLALLVSPIVEPNCYPTTQKSEVMNGQAA